MSISDIGAAPTGRKPKLAELVVDTLRKRIGTGEYDTGAKLPTESQMTKIFGVSRTVVREAIAALAADGIVEARQGAGVFVIARAGMRRHLVRSQELYRQRLREGGPSTDSRQ